MPIIQVHAWHLGVRLPPRCPPPTYLRVFLVRRTWVARILVSTLPGVSLPRWFHLDLHWAQIISLHLLSPLKMASLINRVSLDRGRLHTWIRGCVGSRASRAPLRFILCPL